LLLELEKDEKTKVIVMYLESIEFGREFYNIAKRVTKSKPIILVKSGMSDR
jgi:acetyltransferase